MRIKRWKMRLDNLLAHTRHFEDDPNIRADEGPSWFVQQPENLWSNDTETLNWPHVQSDFAEDNKDGVLQRIFQVIGETNKKYVEIGVGPGPYE
jgi:hypothetical protein